MLVSAVSAKVEQHRARGGRLGWAGVCVLAGVAAGSAWRAGTGDIEEPSGMDQTPHLAKLVAEHPRSDPPDTGRRASPARLTRSAEPGAAGATRPGERASVEEAEAPVAEAGSQDEPDSAASDSARYHIQVASLTSGTRALSLASALERLGFPARALPSGSSRGRFWYVVRVGPFDSRVDAERRRLDLPREQRHTAEVIPHARGPFFAQVASLLSRGRSRALSERLIRQGHHARAVFVSTPEGKRWHSVRIGPFDTRQEAASYRDLLPEPERHGTAVIPYDPRPSG